MTTATIYIAKDGKEFRDEMECKEYEELLNRQDQIKTYVIDIIDFCHKMKDCIGCCYNRGDGEVGDCMIYQPFKWKA